MLFKELKQGDVIYLYDADKIELRIENVVGVTPPYPDKNNIARMSVDVTISNAGRYALHDSEVIGSNGSLVISTDKACILREVEAQRANRAMVVSKADAYKEEMPKIDAVIEQLSPEIQQKKQQEERLSKMETDISAMKSMFESFMRKNGKYEQ